MSAPRKIPQISRWTIRGANETWQAYALRLSDMGWSSRQIGKLLGKHHCTVLKAINPEYRRDCVLYLRRLRSQMSAEDRRIDNLSAKVRYHRRAEVRAASFPPAPNTKQPAKRQRPDLSWFEERALISGHRVQE